MWERLLIISKMTILGEIQTSLWLLAFFLTVSAFLLCILYMLLLLHALIGT